MLVRSPCSVVLSGREKRPSRALRRLTYNSARRFAGPPAGLPVSSNGGGSTGLGWLAPLGRCERHSRQRQLGIGDKERRMIADHSREVRQQPFHPAIGEDDRILEGAGPISHDAARTG